MLFRVSWRVERIVSAVRVSSASAGAATTAVAAAGAAAGAAAVTTGSVTSVLEAAFARGALAGVVAVAGGATVSVFAAALVTFESFAILFELTEVEEEGISNAVGMLIHNLTCLNHKLYNPLIIIKHGWNGSEQSFKIESRTLEIMYK